MLTLFNTPILNSKIISIFIFVMPYKEDHIHYTKLFQNFAY